MTREIREGAGIQGIIAGFGKGVTGLINICLAAVVWGARLTWNGCWILFSLFMIAVGLFSLYGLGVLAILLMQGYPFVGVLVGCLGLVFCTFSAAGLGLSFLWRRRKRTAPMMAAFTETGEEEWQDA